MIEKLLQVLRLSFEHIRFGQVSRPAPELGHRSAATDNFHGEGLVPAPEVFIYHGRIEQGDGPVHLPDLFVENAGQGGNHDKYNDD